MIAARLRLSSAVLLAMFGIVGLRDSVPIYGDDAPWEWRPYRVELALEPSGDSALPEAFVAAVQADAESRLRERFSIAWAWPFDGETNETAKADKRFIVQL